MSKFKSRPKYLFYMNMLYTVGNEKIIGGGTFIVVL